MNRVKDDKHNFAINALSLHLPYFLDCAALMQRFANCRGGVLRVQLYCKELSCTLSSSSMKGAYSKPYLSSLHIQRVQAMIWGSLIKFSRSTLCAIHNTGQPIYGESVTLKRIQHLNQCLAVPWAKMEDGREGEITPSYKVLDQRIYVYHI